MKTLFFNPNLFFSEKLKKEVSFKNPVLIMLALSLIALISSFLVMNKIKEFLPSDANSFMYVLIIGGAVGAVVSTFIYWVILTGIFYLISSVFHAEGSFKRTLEFVSYGFVPQLFGGIVSLFVLYTVLPSLNASPQNPQLFAESIKQTLLNNPLSLTSQAFGILCFLLSANIWVFGLMYARKLSVKNAIITVGIPVGISLIYQAYVLIGGLT
jgi:hypothetical protein